MPEPLISIPPGYGLIVVPPDRWFDQGADTDDMTILFDRLLIWEPRLPGHQYVVSVDVSDGMGLDRSVIEVTRVGDMNRPDEQVAQFVTAEVDAISLAYIVDPIGRYYCDDDGMEALLAVETNSHGIGTQGELQRHLGYANFYIWQYEDSLDPRKRHTRRIGWVTSPRTRPQLLSRYFKALTSYDPRTNLPDLIINSPITVSELREFQAPPGMSLAYAEGATHDDCVMAGAIGEYVCWTIHADSVEPQNERRHRLAEEKARKAALSERLQARRDWANTDATVEEMDYGITDEDQGYLYD